MHTHTHTGVQWDTCRRISRWNWRGASEGPLRNLVRILVIFISLSLLVFRFFLSWNEIDPKLKHNWRDVTASSANNSNIEKFRSITISHFYEFEIDLRLKLKWGVVTLSTALKFASKFFRKWSFFDQNQQPLNSVEPFERIFRALDMAQSPYKFSSFLDFRNSSCSDCLFRLFARDFQQFRFFFSGSACFSKLAPPGNLQSWVKYYGKFESFGKEFRWTQFIAVERVTESGHFCEFVWCE